jgi:hypothetical protein
MSSLSGQASKTGPKKMNKRVLQRAAKKTMKSEIKNQCQNLEKKYKTHFVPLSETFVDDGVENCIFKQKIADENFQFFIRAAFYHKKDSVKKEAFKKLDLFECGLKVSCQDFYKTVDVHNKAAEQVQKKDWKNYYSRANSLKEKALAKINQL